MNDSTDNLDSANFDSAGLDSAVRDYYAAQSLDATTLARLRRLAEPKRVAWGWPRVLAAAATLLLAVSAGWYGWSQAAGARLSTALAVDAARLHGTFAVAIDAEDFRQLRDRMPKLKFRPVEPARCRQDDYRVSGARYVTLAGKPVAQIRLSYVEGAPMSLYEMSADDFPNVRAGTSTVDGTPVTVWQEQGLVMALAGTPAE